MCTKNIKSRLWHAQSGCCGRLCDEVCEACGGGGIVVEIGGVKHDQAGDKLRYDLIDPQILEDGAETLTVGAKKYGDRNWEKGLKWSRLYGALMRHLMAFWWDAESWDPEGFHHLGAVFFYTMALRHHETEHPELDDRPWVEKEV